MPEVLGIDLSLTATGLATVSGLQTIKTAPNGDAIKDRLTRLWSIQGTIAGYGNEGDLALIEGPSYGQQRQGGEHLRAGLWWLVADALDQRGVRLVEVPPAALKKYATGKGNATKPDMRMALYQRADFDVRDDNQVDAFWLRQIGLHLCKDPAALAMPKTHLIALDKIRVPL